MIVCSSSFLLYSLKLFFHSFSKTFPTEPRVEGKILTQHLGYKVNLEIILFFPMYQTMI